MNEDELAQIEEMESDPEYRITSLESWVRWAEPKPATPELTEEILWLINRDRELDVELEAVRARVKELEHQVKYPGQNFEDER